MMLHMQELERNVNTFAAVTGKLPVKQLIRSLRQDLNQVRTANFTDHSEVSAITTALFELEENLTEIADPFRPSGPNTETLFDIWADDRGVSSDITFSDYATRLTPGDLRLWQGFEEEAERFWSDLHRYFIRPAHDVRKLMHQIMRELRNE